MKGIFGRPSPAMVVAVVALIAALGGSAIAGGVLKKKKVKKIAAHQVNRLAPGLSVKHAGTANTADGAGNANQLGGIPPSGYTHSDCNSQTGQIKGWAAVNGSSTFSSSFVAVPGYNCASGFGTTGQVLAKRDGIGGYEVKFPNNPARIVIGSTTTGFVDQHSTGPGLFVVGVRAPGGALTDQAFDVLSP